ncbi:hypothetical protein NC652_035740 [Populus alba x Populus x berolinensis]|nr:hypothetical protein NC652_035740 [Populus alba x Populus x berolinensis]
MKQQLCLSLVARFACWILFFSIIFYYTKEGHQSYIIFWWFGS